MNRTEIIAHLQIALSAVLNRDIPELPEDARLFDELGLDSTSVIELLMALSIPTSWSPRSSRQSAA